MDISPELVDRLVALVRKIDAAKEQFGFCDSLWAEFEAVAAELPDPDLIEAREMVARSHDRWAAESPWHANEAEKTRSGGFDLCFRVADTLAGIKRGRELANEKRSS